MTSGSTDRSSLPRRIVRLTLGALYGVAGALHLALPAPFIAITPQWVPAPALVIALTGVAELAGAAALVQPFRPALRHAAGWGLAAYALCVWPANVNHMLIDLSRAGHGLGLGYHVPRMMAQPLLIWAALWAAGITGWPFARCQGSVAPSIAPSIARARARSDG